MPSKLKNANNFQEKWNEVLQKHAPENISLAREISELLDISLDSAYRRLRNETDYTLDEAALIANHFNIPLEALNNERHAMVSFRTNALNNDLASYTAYLENMLGNIKRLASFETPQLFFGAEDIPVFYHYSSEHLLKFKITYWLKSLMLVPEFQNMTYDKIEIPEFLTQTAQEIFKNFAKVNSTEIWTAETVLSTVKQIKFYWEAGFFEVKDEALLVVDDLEACLRRIQKQAETGYMFNANGTMSSSSYRLFVSDVMIGTNSILAKAGDHLSSYISYSTFNFMQTSNTDFNLQNELWMNNLMSRSTMISTVAEKQRNQFFKSIYRTLADLKQYINDTV